MRSTAVLAAAAALALNTHAESLYTKHSSVLQITGIDYDRLIAKSNYTSIVEFYAPWCGHCKNLKPVYEAAAKSLAGIAKVAAVNCDDEMNKPFCGQMGVQGFPTLKIVRPGKKPGKPTVEDYQGQRNAKAIVEAVKDKIPNTVKRVTDKNLDEWLQENNGQAKAILFSDKGLVSATLRAVAIDFAGLISVAQIRNKEAAAVKRYGIKEFPTLILLPAGSGDAIKYEGEVKKESIVEFLSQVATPNPDCPPPKAKSPKAKKGDKKESKSASKFSKASAFHKSADASSAAASGTAETLEEPLKPSESPDPNIKTEGTPEPIVINQAEPSIPILVEADRLQSLCLNDKAATCILAILPKDESLEAATAVISSLSSIHAKHNHKIFPFVGVSASNPLASSLITELNLGSADEVHLIATHGKRAWWKKHSIPGFGAVEIEQWVDAIRMGEGKKEKLPEALLASQEQAEGKREKPAEQEPLKIDLEEMIEDEPNTHHEHWEL